ncbi:hypothetical protein GC194_04345 [bacterium]|nr:hypothetical protein [bacterium]
MKLRIKGNSIRLRLTQSEVAQFAETEICFDRISFGSTELVYQLHMAEVESMKADLTNNTLSVEVPYESAEKWATSDEEVSLEHYQPLQNGEQLYILVEKDFACLKPRDNEDESDNFPNPNADSETC